MSSVENFEIPKVYHKFMAMDKNNENLIEYRIQGLPREYFETATDLLLKDFISEESFNVALDLSSKINTNKHYR